LYQKRLKKRNITSYQDTATGLAQNDDRGFRNKCTTTHKPAQGFALFGN
jgi:hypothetical protein